jgi:hypothetical protein
MAVTARAWIQPSRKRPWQVKPLIFAAPTANRRSLLDKPVKRQVALVLRKLGARRHDGHQHAPGFKNS